MTPPQGARRYFNISGIGIEILARRENCAGGIRLGGSQPNRMKRISDVVDIEPIVTVGVTANVVTGQNVKPVTDHRHTIGIDALKVGVVLIGVLVEAVDQSRELPGYTDRCSLGLAVGDCGN
jgi:hypothetical protein